MDEKHTLKVEYNGDGFWWVACDKPEPLAAWITQRQGWARLTRSELYNVLFDWTDLNPRSAIIDILDDETGTKYQIALSR